jgi:signal transduction histidine kinase
MKPYRELSINTKLTLLVVLAGGVALLLSCVAFVTNDVRMIRASMITQMSTLAQVLGSNSSAALSFDDPKTASELLHSLEEQPAVEFACLYDSTGRLFATYQRGGTQFTPPTAPSPAGFSFTRGGYLDVTRSIANNGQLVGTIYLHASMDDLYDQIFWYINIVAAVMIFSLAASILLSSRVRRVISLPILNLAEAAQRISQDSNYSIRVVKQANDELGTLYDQFNAMLDQIQQRDAAIQQAHDDLEAKVQHRTSQLSQANEQLTCEIAERQKTQLELQAAHSQLVTAARRAGMAEIATGVLHNVGNVLNSINVSATLASDRLRQSKINELLRATKLLDEHQQDLGSFITSDPKGKQLPRFLSLVATHLADERSDILKELELLNTKVNHVKTIVSTQQSYAGVSGVTETVDLATLIDDAMKLNSASIDRHRIQVTKEYDDIPKVRLDKQKVLQILVNLIKNAKDACLSAPHCKERRVTLRTRLTPEGTIQIHTIDNGVGIPPEHLTRIFSHGFTTKNTGHGFGLHSCANAASELNGSLLGYSDGPDKGATFVLELPFEPAEVPA